MKALPLLSPVLLASVVFAVVELPRSASAQVVVSMTAEQVYDSNVYLESGDRVELPPGVVLPDGSTELPDDLDGEEDSDLITNVKLSLGGGEVVAKRNLNFVYNAGVGALFFWDIEDEDRVTLDSFLELSTREELLSEPWVASLSSAFTSGGADVAVAEGTAASQVQTHSAEFRFAAEDYQVSSRSHIDAGYRLTRHDFLGEWLLSERDNDRRDPIGSDFFANSIDGSYVYNLSPSTDANLDVFGTLLNFTGTDGGVEETVGSEDEAFDGEHDRIDYGARVGLTRLFSPKLRMRTAVGADLSYLIDDPEDVFEERLNPDGTTTTVLATPSNNSSSFAFSVNLDYQAAEATTVSVFAEQSSGVDTDGSRILIRSFGVNAAHRLTEVLWLSGAGRYQQFDEGDSLGNSTDRFDTSIALRYVLAPNVSLTGGYNFTTQDSDEPLLGAGTDSSDYDSHRAFVSFNVGFVGLPA